MKTSTYFKTGMLTASILALSGCATVAGSGDRLIASNIAEDSIRLNEAFSQSTNAIILKNVLRARDRWPTSYTTLSGISSKPTFASPSLTLSPLGRGEVPRPLGTSATTLTPLSAAEKSYNVQPFSARDRSESLLKPVAETTFDDFLKSWPQDVVLLMFLNEVEFKVSDPSDATGEKKKTIKIRNSGDNFLKFKKRLAAALYSDDSNYQNKFSELPESNNELDFKKDIRLVPSEKAKKETACGQQDFAVKELLSKNSGRFGNLQKLKELTGATVTVEAASKNKLALKVCQKSETTNVLVLDPEKGGVAGRELSFSLRSFDDMIYYVGETLRISDINKRPQVSTPCKTNNQSKLGPLFKVYENLESGDFAAEVEHNGETIKAVKASSAVDTDTACLKERSSTVMALLNQLLLLNQSEKFLDAPQIIDR